MNRKQRLHQIWEKLEHIATELGDTLEIARNGEQIELLRDSVGYAPILSEMLDLLREIQQSPQAEYTYIAHLRAKTVNTLKDRIERILEDE